MRLASTLLVPALLCAAASSAAAQEVGSPIPATIELEGYSQTEAQSFEDLLGRAVLIEFFAYW